MGSDFKNSTDMKKIRSILTLIAASVSFVGCSFDSGEIAKEQTDVRQLKPEFVVTPDGSSGEITDMGRGADLTRSLVYREEDGMKIAVVLAPVDPSVSYYNGTAPAYVKGGGNKATIFQCHIDSIDGKPDLTSARWEPVHPLVVNESKAYVYAFYPAQFFHADAYDWYDILADDDPESSVRYWDYANDKVNVQALSEFTCADNVRVRLNGRPTSAATPQWAYGEMGHQLDWMYGVAYDGSKLTNSFNHPQVNIDNYSTKLYMRHAQAMIRIIVYKGTYIAANEGVKGAVTDLFFGDISKRASTTGAALDDTPIFYTGTDIPFNYVSGKFEPTAKTESCLHWDFSGENPDTGLPYTEDEQIDIDTLTTYIIPTAGAAGLVKISLTIDGQRHTTKAVTNYNWEAGKVYTYVVNVGNQPLEIEEKGITIADWVYTSVENLGVVD